MVTQSRLYKTITILLSISIFLGTIPVPVWAEMLGVNNAISTMPNLTGYPPLPAIGGNNDLVDIFSDELFSELMESSNLPALNDQPEGLLLDPMAMQNLMNGSLTEPTPQRTPLTISRVQSDYSTGTALDNTMVVTLTVTNNQPPVNFPQVDPNATITDTINVLANVDFSNDPNVIRNVLLTDEFLPDTVTFLAASPVPTRNDDTYAWNLGDIPPLESVDVSLQLQIPVSVTSFTHLDVGAAVWGSLQGKSVSGTTSPITLAPDGFDEWLTCTIDADCDDEYVVEKAAELGNDPIAIFYYMRSLGFESYKGSLRGARGTLWSEAGNSMDQSSLLIALLRARSADLFLLVLIEKSLY